MYYLDTETVKAAYARLISIDFSNQSILHIFLILKGIGVNSLSYSLLDDIKNHALPYAQDLGYLFSPLEESPEKNDFINPFLMKEWATNPTERLTKWVGGRIKNNVIGGATTWRSFIMQDTDEDFKFSYNYVSEIAKLTINESRIPLAAIAIWANRFTQFDEKVSLSELITSFCSRFHITQEELNLLFETKTVINLSFSNNLHSTQDIRQLIGNPAGMTNWVVANRIITTVNIDENNSVIRRFNTMSNSTIKKETLEFILSNYYQLILSGPPATSKSYLVSEIAKGYKKAVHIQFHPQYSYQQFMGGYYVEGTNVIFRKGVFYNLVAEAKANEKEKYLLVIDEINRANTGQVFGEMIQALDRGSKVQVQIDDKLEVLDIPTNLHIVGTMNSTDRSIGSLDYALKRRFLTVYCGSNPKALIDLTSSVGDMVSICDFLEKLNTRIVDVLKNREFVIGHAVFFENSRKNASGKYEWDFASFEVLFNYKILPIIEDYSGHDIETIKQIVGDKLIDRLSGEEFKKAAKEFVG